MRELRVSFLHVAPIVCEVDHNRKLLESALRVAAEQGADWVVTPELCIPGYLFQKVIGTDWILHQPDPWMRGFCQSIKEYQLTKSPHLFGKADRDLRHASTYGSYFSHTIV